MVYIDAVNKMDTFFEGAFTALRTHLPGLLIDSSLFAFLESHPRAVGIAILFLPVLNMIMWPLLRFRMLPYPWMYTVWYGASLASGFIICAAIYSPFVLLKKYGLLEPTTLYYGASSVSSWTGKVIYFLNPQIRYYHDLSRMGFDAINEITATGEGVCFNFNHASLEDGIGGCFGQLPTNIINQMRMLGKESTMNMHIVGFVFRECHGYYRVFFVEDDKFAGAKVDSALYDDWRIADREKQEAELQEIFDWIAAGKIFGYSVEGRCNRTPSKISSPRHGLIKRLHKAKVPLFTMTMWPPAESWPPGAVFGGLPVDGICLTLGRYEWPSDAEVPVEEDGEQSVKFIAEHLQKWM